MGFRSSGILTFQLSWGGSLLEIMRQELPSPGGAGHALQQDPSDLSEFIFHLTHCPERQAVCGLVAMLAAKGLISCCCRSRGWVCLPALGAGLKAGAAVLSPNA